MDKLFNPIFGLFLTICIFGVIPTAEAASTEALIKQGNDLFSAGKFDEAIRTYDEAAVDDPESPIIYFNKGAAFYKKEDYAAARDAFGQAAIKTKDIRLEAKSRYNLGLCFFKEGERQRDSDLKKTLESYESSILSFQEALDLDPEFTEAAENIELVRLMMKSVLDEIKKQEEAAQKQQEQTQETAEAIKKLIEEQKNLLDETRSLISSEQAEDMAETTPESMQEPHGEKNTRQNNDIAKDLAGAQEQLKNDTQNISGHLADQTAPSAAGPSGIPAGTPSPVPEHPSKEHLDASIAEQGNALENFANDDPRIAADHQQKSLKNLEKALDALSGGQENQQGGQPQPENKSNQDKQNQNAQSSGDEESVPDAPAPEEPDPASTPEQEPAAGLTDDPDHILNEEKENKKHRTPVTSGGFKQVDKDW